MGLKGEKLQNKKTFVLALLLAMLLMITALKLFLWVPSIPSVSAVGTDGSIGIYWDANCSQKVASIDWGTLTLGEVKQVVVYVRNEGNQTVFLALTTLNWQPENASMWLHFLWTCQTARIVMKETIKVTPNLEVAPNIPRGFSSISFDLLFSGLDHLLGDINKDGIVDVKDLVVLALAYASTASDPRWNPDADLNKDGVINILDLAQLAENMGKIGT